MAADRAPRRVVSLIASSTEIVCALGCEGALVGRSHECDFPRGVESLPALTRPRLDPRASGRAISDRVQELVSRGLSIYELDAALLRELRPDLILTQTLCEVCAATPADLASALAAWTGARPAIVSLAPLSLDDVLGDVARIGAALGLAARAAELGAGLRARIEALTALGRSAATRPRVAALEWLDPPIAGGNWMPELIERAGGSSVFGKAGEHSPRIAWEELEAAAPDVVVVVPCGLGLAQARAELARTPRLARFRTAVLDGNQYFNRPGPRIVESLAILLGVIHPELNPRTGDPAS
ncbi:MAG TPA: ABC transporter substrate-binding protein [Myxococcota bacterium]|nr:ABC transporter substrate-binding protein [Myxococcota bacterium]